MSAAGYGKRKSPPPGSPSQDSKRARLDSPLDDSAAASPAPSFASSLSYQDSPHVSSPEVELSLASFQHQAGKSAPVLDTQEEDDSDAEGDLDLDLGLVDDDDDDDMPLGLQQHHTLSAKSVPSKQPRPSDILGQHNGNGHGGGGGVAAKKAPSQNGMVNGHGGRPVVGGKGRRGEEQIEHAVAAREETERRRAEMGKSTVQGASKALVGGSTGVVPAGAVPDSEGMEVENKDEPLKVKLEEDEVVVVPEEDDPEPASHSSLLVSEYLELT